MQNTHFLVGIMFLLSKIFKSNKSKTVNNWLDVYIKILFARKLKYKTLEIKTYLIKVIRREIGNKNIRDVSPLDISKIIQIYIDQDKRPSAKSMYHLLIEQQKTGSKIALPVKLKCKKVGLSIYDIINKSPAQFVVTKKGEQVLPEQITSGFARIRDKVFSREYWSGTPTTFHEIRSLAERLYREQNIDTMTLLGHKSQQTTDRYNDNRGREYKKLKLTRATYL